MSTDAGFPGNPLARDRVRQAIREGSVADWLQRSGFRSVHLGLVDASGVLRSKRLEPTGVTRAFEEGWSFIDAIQWWAPDDTLWHQASATSQPATVDPTSGRRYPFAADAAFFLAEFAPPLCDLSPRFQLHRMAELAETAGLEVAVGWEFECIVLQEGAAETSGSPTRRDPLAPAMAANRCWSALTPAIEDEALGALIDTLGAGDIPVDHVCAELGAGCLEIATGPEDAVRSADSAALAKLYTKAHFAREGRRATFMAQLGSEFPGLGGHPSLSLRSTVDGAPVLQTRIAASDPATGLPPRRRGASATTAVPFGPCSIIRAPPGWSSGSQGPTPAHITASPCSWGPPSGALRNASSCRRP
jgi:glutamine synthetase